MPDNDSPSQPESAVAAPDGTRRALVAVAACTPVLAAAMAILRRRAPAATTVAAPVPAAPAAEDVGYHETDHIRRYYRSAKYF